MEYDIAKMKIPSPLPRLPDELVTRSHAPGVSVITRHYRDAREDLIHEHDFFELVFVRSGTGLHITGSGEYPIARGDLFLVRPGAPHGYRELKRLEIVNILYLPERFGFVMHDLADCAGYQAFFETAPQLSERFRFDNRLTLSGETLEEADAVIRDLELEEKSGRAGAGFAQTTLFMRLLLLVSRAAAQREAGTYDEVLRVSSAMQYLRRNFTRNPAIKEAARAAGVSLRTLERLFQTSLGTTPGSWLNELRLEKGAELLSEPDCRVGEAARRAGFTDSNYFSKLFHRKFGLSPREYRRKTRTVTSSTERR